MTTTSPAITAAVERASGEFEMPGAGPAAWPFASMEADLLHKDGVLRVRRLKASGDGSAARLSGIVDTGRETLEGKLSGEIDLARVQGYPKIQGVLTGDSQITGNFDNKSANQLASQLRYGALPVTFVPQEQQNVTATLGDSQLRAGLLAAGIGMLLVIIYSFFYYRLLGSVIFLSLPGGGAPSGA